MASLPLQQSLILAPPPPLLLLQSVDFGKLLVCIHDFLLFLGADEIRKVRSQRLAVRLL